MKKTLFFENAKMLTHSLGIVPVMYGSLGLEYITEENLFADDIDILIPEIFLNEKWQCFKKFLENNGYTLVDEHEHTFEKNGISVSYASAEELETFAGISLFDIAVHIKDGVKFKVLSPEQYLKVYNASSKDGYRINVRKKKDNEKIDFIKNILKKEKKDDSKRFFV